MRLQLVLQLHPRRNRPLPLSIKHSERHVVVLAVGRYPIGSRLSGSGKLLLRYCAMDVRDDSDDLLASCERQGNLLAEWTENYDATDFT